LRGECWEDSFEIEIEAAGNWWDTASGIVAKAREVGVAISEYEPIPVLRDKVKAALARGGLRVVG
jgi:hypothetical protein